MNWGILAQKCPKGHKLVFFAAFCWFCLNWELLCSTLDLW